MLSTNSHPITFNPCSNPAIKVVPLPAKGSNIVDNLLCAGEKAGLFVGHTEA